jgi:hypothetical protein
VKKEAICTSETLLCRNRTNGVTTLPSMRINNYTNSNMSYFVVYLMTMSSSYYHASNVMIRLRIICILHIAYTEKKIFQLSHRTQPINDEMCILLHIYIYIYIYIYRIGLKWKFKLSFTERSTWHGPACMAKLRKRAGFTWNTLYFTYAKCISS